MMQLLRGVEASINILKILNHHMVSFPWLANMHNNESGDSTCE